MLTHLSSFTRIVFIALGTAFLLVIPVLGNRYIDGWNWTGSDFVFAFVMIFGTAVAFELITRRAAQHAYKWAVGVGLVTTFLLIWINGAVGIIGSEDNPANLLYGAVVAVVLLGSIIARLRPRGMSYVMFTAAVVQILVPVTALIIWRPDFSPGVVQIFILNAGFAAMYAGAGVMFRI